MNLQFDHRYIKAYYKMAKLGHQFKLTISDGGYILGNAFLYGLDGLDIKNNFKYYFDKMLTYEEALGIAQIHQIVNPNMVVCGSLALMIQNKIPKRLLHDIDFVNITSDVVITTAMAQHYPIKENDGYKCYTDAGFYFNRKVLFNVFVFDKPDVHFSVLNGVKVQKVGQVLKYKREYNRKKDREDLKNMID